MKKKITSMVLLAAIFTVLCTGCAPRHAAPPPPPAPGTPPAGPTK